jgi:hypothetical protein
VTDAKHSKLDEQTLKHPNQNQEMTNEGYRTRGLKLNGKVTTAKDNRHTAELFTEQKSNKEVCKMQHTTQAQHKVPTSFCILLRTCYGALASEQPKSTGIDVGELENRYL